MNEPNIHSSSNSDSSKNDISDHDVEEIMPEGTIKPQANNNNNNNIEGPPPPRQF